MLAELTQVQALVADCVDAPGWSLPDTDLVDSLDAVHRLEQTLGAVKLRLVREADARALPAVTQAGSTTAWLRERWRVNPSTARRLVNLAKDLDRRPVLDQALAAGSVNTEQAAVILDTVTALPSELGVEEIDKAEGLLIDWAQDFAGQSLRRLGSRIVEHVAPEVAERVEAVRLAREEARAVAGRAFTLSPVVGGRVRLSGWLDTEAAAIVSAALDPLCSPRRAGTHHGQPTDHDQPAAGHGLPAAHGRPATDHDDGLPADHGHGVPDERTPAQRRADALVEICQLALRTEELPVNGGDRPQLHVVIDFEALRRQIGAGTLDTGEHLTPTQVRRLACDAQILPAVLNGHGQILDVGQTRRLFTGPLRRALVLRDRGCAFPGCDRPPRWCDGHHIHSWIDDGPTSLSNAVLLCRHHHRLIHQTQWTVRLGHDGLPEFLPPEFIDPHQRPRRNTYHPRT